MGRILGANEVGLMRGFYATRRDDSAFCGMIDDLCSLSPEFDRFRKETTQQGTSSYAPNRVHLQVSEFGELDFLSVRHTVRRSGDWAIFLAPVDATATTAMLNLAPRITINR